MRRVAAATFLLAAFAAGTAFAAAQSSSQYNRCVAWAEQQSGYYGAAPNPAQNAPLRGAAAGAAGGAFLCGVTGGNAGTGAAIGAAFGAIAGGVRRRENQAAAQNKENAFYSAFNACMNRPPQ
jgi:outer membrane lipoprotein SlyB